ncbi:hypothetical protein K435DRAFT_854316 [Dendrothele bispora CBS 962.96]|uniref:FAD/NAD(P)-binding domain-containing protein n=1 Tax=Dendrothele bispora (strain CBS 962.96) TaxID=1314807 RepID=A0A4S8MES4_DENBC|nr:hypothetical protein K435DRAFT_854316 [Dendrothele bispora CBS 962.96]
MLIESALGYTIQLSANSNDVGGGTATFSCDLNPPKLQFQSGLGPGFAFSMRTIRLFHHHAGSNADFFESSSSQRGPSYYTNSLFSRIDKSPLTNGKVDESSKMHFKVVSCYSIVPTNWVIISGSRPAFYLAQADLDSVLLEGFMGNGFTAGGQRTATVNGILKNFPGFPTSILGPELMNKYREQPLCFGQEDEEFETVDTVIVTTGASVKRLGLKGEEAYWQSGIGTCATIVRNTVATESPDNGELLKNLWNRNTQTGKEKDLAVNGFFYALGHEPATAIFPHPIPDRSRWIYFVTVPGTTQSSVRGVFAAGDVQDKRYGQAVTSAGSGCMAALEAERLIAEGRRK